MLLQKFKDRILLGLAAGIISTLPSRILNRIENRSELTDVKYNLMAANLFLQEGKVNTPTGRIVGAITNHFNTGVVGILITYLLSATGRDHAVLKGAVTGALSWITVFGLTSRIFPVRAQKPLAPHLSFLDHTLFGSLCGLAVSKLGDDSLFPDSQRENKEKKLPIIANLHTSHK